MSVHLIWYVLLIFKHITYNTSYTYNLSLIKTGKAITKKTLGEAPGISTTTVQGMITIKDWLESFCLILI